MANISLSWTFFLFSAATLGIIIAIFLWLRRGSPGYLSFVLLMLAGSIWLFASAMESATLNYWSKIFWAKIQYIGIPWIGVLWLFFSIGFTQAENRLSRRLILILSIIPVISNILVFTNEFHFLIWTRIVPDDLTGGQLLIFYHGLWFWVLVIYNYLLVFLGILRLISAAVSYNRIFRVQITVLIFGASIPLLANFSYILGISPQPAHLTPFSFVITGGLYAFTLVNFKLFQNTPVAWEVLAEKLVEAVIVLDKKLKIIDLNPAGRKVLFQTQDPIGKSIRTELPWLSGFLDREEVNNETIQCPQEPPVWMEIHIYPLYHRKKLNGRLLVLRDISDRITDQKVLQHLLNVEQQRSHQLEVLRNIGVEVLSNLSLDELLRVILDNSISLLDATFGELALYRKESNDLEIQVVHGLSVLHQNQRMSVGEGLMGAIALSRKPLIIENYQTWPGRSKQYPDIGLSATLGVPLVYGEELLGVISIGVDAKKHSFVQADLDLLEMFAQQAALAIHNAHLFARLEELSVTDMLTGLFNRRYFFEQGGNELERAQRYEKPVSLIMADLDFFKKVNDSYGHQKGDEVLQIFARMLKSSFRRVDIVARYGGEEFTILMPETGIEEAFQAAERVRKLMEKYPFVFGDQTIHITASFGIASVTLPDEKMDDLVFSADMALYAAKQSGRNNSRISTPKLEP